MANMTILISEDCLRRMGLYKDQGLSHDEICTKLRDDGFPEEEVISVKALLSGRLKNRHKIHTIKQ